MTNSLKLDIAQIGPALIGYRLETQDENGYRVGIRLARYEIITEHDGSTLYLLYSDPAPVTVRVRPGAILHVVGAASAPMVASPVPAGPAAPAQPPHARVPAPPGTPAAAAPGPASRSASS